MDDSQDISKKKTLAPLLIIFAFVILAIMICFALKNNIKRSEQLEAEKNRKILTLVEQDQEIMDSSDKQLTTFVVPNFRISLGNVRYHLNNGNYIEAEKILQQLFLYYPSSVEITVLLADVFYHLKKYPEAEQCYQKQLMFYPDDSTIQNNLSMVQMEQGKIEDALSNINLAIANSPVERGELLMNQAVILEQNGEHEKAVKSFSRAITLLGDRIYPTISAPIFDSLRKSPEIQKLLNEKENANKNASSPSPTEESPAQTPQQK